MLVFSLYLGASAETINDKNEAISAKKEEINAKVEQMQEKVSFFKSLILKFKKVEVESLKTKTLKNFNVAIRNLENLAIRVGSRIEKSETQNKDIISAKISLENANVQIQKAKEEVIELSEIIPDSFDKNSNKETKDTVKEQTKITKESIQTAQSALIEAISSIKGQDRNDEEAEVSSTSENINQDE